MPARPLWGTFLFPACHLFAPLVWPETKCLTQDYKHFPGTQIMAFPEVLGKAWDCTTADHGWLLTTALCQNPRVLKSGDQEDRSCTL